MLGKFLFLRKYVERIIFVSILELKLFPLKSYQQLSFLTWAISLTLVRATIMSSVSRTILGQAGSRRLQLKDISTEIQQQRSGLEQLVSISLEHR